MLDSLEAFRVNVSSLSLLEADRDALLVELPARPYIMGNWAKPGYEQHFELTRLRHIVVTPGIAESSSLPLVFSGFY